MKRLFSFSVFTALMLVAVPRTDAQIFQKLFGKKEKKQVHKPTNKPTPTKPATKKPSAPARKSHSDQMDLPRTVRKERYRVDVLASIYLNETVKGGKSIYAVKLPEKVLPGLNFYEGIKLATDSLNKLGYQMDVYVHDITDPLSSIETLINTNTLDSSDLIIGAVSTPQVPTLAKYAQKRKINFVSALSPSDANIKGNPYFTLLQPTLQTHCEFLRSTISRRYPRQKVLVYHRSTGVDETAFRTLIRDNLFTYTPISANTLPTPAQLRSELDSTITNVIVVPIVDVASASKILESIAKDFPQYRFEVYGMPSWKGMNKLKKEEAASNTVVYITAPFYYDASTGRGQMIASGYRKLFGGHPAEMTYRGYETLTWYAYLLSNYGTIFNEKVSDNSTAIFTRFDVKPRWDKDDNLLYNENTHLYLYRFEGGSFSVEQ